VSWFQNAFDYFISCAKYKAVLKTLQSFHKHRFAARYSQYDGYVMHSKLSLKCVRIAACVDIVFNLCAGERKHASFCFGDARTSVDSTLKQALLAVKHKNRLKTDQRFDSWYSYLRQVENEMVSAFEHEHHTTWALQVATLWELTRRGALIKRYDVKNNNKNRGWDTGQQKGNFIDTV